MKIHVQSLHKNRLFAGWVTHPKGGNRFPKFNIGGGGGLTRNLDIFGICLLKQKFLIW